MGLKEALQSVNVPLTPAIGTLTAWADFRNKLKEQTFEAESQLWDELFVNSKILVISG